MLIRGSCYWVGLLLLGCASSPLRIEESGFRNDKLDYDVLFQSGRQQLLPDDWRLDNFYGKGALDSRPKLAHNYVTVLQLDVDGDGQSEQKDTFPSYELRFEHRHSNGIIALRALVLSQYDTEKDLRLLTSDMVASIAGGYDFHVNEESVTNANVRLAARQVAEGPAKLAGQEAYASVVDVANVDQALISAQAVTRRMELVLVRSGLTYTPERRNAKFPVYLSGLYIEHPTQFDAHLPAFKQLLGQIRIAGHTGYGETLKAVSLPATPQEAPSQPVAPPASPSEASASESAS